jgi:precorrin-2 dehydrogenase/sirohydrochlorin ferrochelatase
MPYYPAFLNIEGRRALVVGGGEVAARKILPLLEARAHVTVVSPEVHDDIRRLAGEGRIVWHARAFAPSDLEGVFLVVGATDDRALNPELYRLCEGKKILLNAADDPRHCHFVVPSALRQGELQIAVATGGSGPRLSRHVRLMLEKLFGEEYAKFTVLLKKMRTEIQKKIPAERRVAFYDALIESDILEIYRLGNDEAAERLARDILETHSRE